MKKNIQKAILLSLIIGPINTHASDRGSNEPLTPKSSIQAAPVPVESRAEPTHFIDMEKRDMKRALDNLYEIHTGLILHLNGVLEEESIFLKIENYIEQLELNAREFQERSVQQNILLALGSHLRLLSKETALDEINTSTNLCEWALSCFRWIDPPVELEGSIVMDGGWSSSDVQYKKEIESLLEEKSIRELMGADYFANPSA